MNENQTETLETPAVTTEQVASPTEQTAALEGEQKQVESKTFTQAELNEIIQAEKAKAEAKAERRANKAYRETLERFAPQQQTQAPASDAPQRDKYATDEAWLDARDNWRDAKREQVQADQRQAESNRSIASKTEKMYQAAEKLAGFNRESFDEVLSDHGTPTIAQAVIESDASAQLMAWMSANPDDVERIAKLSPTGQAKEIGRLEAKLSVVKQAKDLPEPIKTLSGTGAVSNGDPSRMSMDEYMIFRKKGGASWAR